VLPALTNDLLGATPTGPGFATWSVRPHPGTVTWARGQLPTPHGPLKVSWTNGKNVFALTIDAPRGTSGTITVPASGKRVQLIVNGRQVRVLAGHTVTVRG
jgi:hypothetical protein